ncbi:type I polyketide synthase, partial [Bacillus sp. XF8]|uniref:type I polyketide synthase n=1 Tax=Bacillus sp. XF8 TaxID=2819289 RepID=UPI001AA013A6
MMEEIPAQPKAVAEVAASEESQLMTFAERWQSHALSDERMTPPKVWVCFISNPSYQQVLRTALKSRYPETEVIFVAQGTTDRRESPYHYQLNRADGMAYQQTLNSIAAEWGTGFALLYLWPLEDQALINDYMPLFHLFQAAWEAKPARFIWAGEWTTPLERSYLESWIGWERSLGLILPQMGVSGILQKAMPEGLDMVKWLDKLADEMESTPVESVLYEREQRYVCRVEPTDITEGEGGIKEGGTYLITGGGGGLGRRLAANLIRSQSVNLVLTGRSPLSDSLADEIRKWEESGSQVLYCQADVCDRAAMADVRQKAKIRFGGIDGVIHAAGLASKEPLFAKSAADFARVLAPKVQGAQVLDEVFASASLDFVCYFSSSSAILGDMGAGDYAMANRFLMAYAHQRQAIFPGKTLVINWPLWKEGGMGLGDDEQTHMYLVSSGQRTLETEEGLMLFERLLSQTSTQHLVLAGQPERVHRFLGLGQTNAVGSSLERPAVSELPAGQGRCEEMKGLSVQQCVEWDLKKIASNLLQIPRDQLHLESNLADFGFDSITLATFAERLTAHYNVEITPALFFGYPNLGKLADYYMTEHTEGMAAFYREGRTMEKLSSTIPNDMHREEKVQSQSVMPEKLAEKKSRPEPQMQITPRQLEMEPIAVIGMSGRFPGARNIDQMWEHLVKGEEQVQSATRWAQEGEQWRFGEVPGVSEFDPAFFEISPREAQNMDPRQRLLLQEAWKALEDAGYGAKQIERQRIGMFVGVEGGDYKYLSGFNGPITSNHDAILAARLSYVLNLNGPNMAINTACSSGLVGLHQACQSLRVGDCDTAIAAGVNLILMPQTLEAIDQAGMLSPDGRCYAFDERANGMVPGEAVVAVVLKRLSQAQADKDPIYAVIRGSGINYDGKTNGITAPNGVVQAQLYRSVYDQYGIHPESLSYIVTHGTGTRLGDPVEVNGLRDAFRSYTEKEGFCAITSAKTNFGHTFAASGLVSLISLVQAMRHETIPASLHFEQENHYIQWKNSPFYVNKTNREWKDSAGQPRRGAVSAFGMSGTNVHLVVESYPKETQVEKESSLPYYLLALSAKTEEALTEKIADLIAFLESPEGQ